MKRKIGRWADARNYISELERQNEKLTQEIENLRRLRGTHNRRGEFPGGGYYIIERNEPPQQATDKGDEVVVVAKIYLPEKDGKLRDEIHFGPRLKIANRELYYTWGYQKVPGFQSLVMKFVAKTWREAFAKAQKFIDAEAKKLQDALDRREKALQEAEL